VVSSRLITKAAKIEYLIALKFSSSNSRKPNAVIHRFTNRLELALMPAYREPLRRKKQSLGYLCEDLNRKLAKLRDWNNDDQIDGAMLDQAVSLITEVSGLDIGIERRLNDLQYCLGEMQIHLWEDSIEFMQIDDCIAQIQDFLDWN
jgi:hypothetical protein